MNALDQAIWDTRVKEAMESRKEGAVSNKNLAIIAADNAIKRLTDENAALIESADRLMNMRIELEKERNAMREIVEAVARTGVSFGDGEHELEDKHVRAALEICDPPIGGDS